MMIKLEILIVVIAAEWKYSDAAVYYSCKDLYIANSNRSDGIYEIKNREQQPYKVYCDFYPGYGYTYIINSTNVSINMDDLQSEKEYAIVRILKTNGRQEETKLEQLTSYKSKHNLTFLYNNFTGFKAPLNLKMSPYIYLGFLPKTTANRKTIQGYRANNVNFTFNNCDSNGNSYLTFFFNPQNIEPDGYYKTCCDKPLMHGWINKSNAVPKNNQIPSEFFFFFEMHMGGCGGYAVPLTYKDIQGATIAFRFDYTGPCFGSPCQNHGICSDKDGIYRCECYLGYSGSRCEIDEGQLNAQSGISTSAKIGIAIAVLILSLFVAFMIILLIKRRQSLSMSRSKNGISNQGYDTPDRSTNIAGSEQSYMDLDHRIKENDQLSYESLKPTAVIKPTTGTNESAHTYLELEQETENYNYFILENQKANEIKNETLTRQDSVYTTSRDAEYDELNDKATRHPNDSNRNHTYAHVMEGNLNDSKTRKSESKDDTYDHARYTK